MGNPVLEFLRQLSLTAQKKEEKSPGLCHSRNVVRLRMRRLIELTHRVPSTGKRKKANTHLPLPKGLLREGKMCPGGPFPSPPGSGELWLHPM